MNITVRGSDKAVCRRFKAKVIEEGLKVGQALIQAMKVWMEQRSAKARVKLVDIEPFNWGEGTEKASIEMDKILYGGRR